MQKGGKLATRGRASPSGGPFRVSFLGPDGEGLASPQPQIVFSRPVRALGAKPGEPKLPARFTPEVEGRWEWMGTSAARFVPADGFATATRYSLEIGPGITSIDGQTLAEGVRTTFSTQRPALSWTHPREGETEVSLTERASLHFTTTIERSVLEAGLAVVDRAGRPVPFVLEPDGSDWGPSVQIKPKPRWPEADRITIKVAGGMRGRQGDLGTIPREVSFDTRTSLHVTAIECDTHEDGRCRAGADVQVSLSGEMRPSDLFPLVRLTPSPAKLKRLDPRWDSPSSYHRFEIDGETVPGTRYGVEIVPSVARPRQLPREKDGSEPAELRPLKIGAKAELVYAPVEPGVHFSFGGTYVLPTDAEIAARAEETRTAVAGVVALDRDAVMKLEAEPKTAWWDLSGVKTVPLPAREGPKAAPAWLTLAPLTPPAGPVLFGARWQGIVAEEKTASVLQRSDLALFERTSSEGTLAWVTSLRTGAPIEGVSVEARDAFGRRVSAVTGSDGVALLATAAFGRPEVDPEAVMNPSRPSGRRSGHERNGWMVLFAQRDADWIYRRVDAPRPVQMKGALFSDRGLYRPGELANVKGVVRLPTSKGLVPVIGKDVRVEITDPSGRIQRASAPLGPFGTFTHPIDVPIDAQLGWYRVVAFVDGQRVAEDSITVREYRPSSFWVETSLDRKSYTRGDVVTCLGRGAYLYGGSLEGALARASFTRHRFSYQVPGLKGFTIEETSHDGALTPPTDQKANVDRSGAARFTATLENVTQRGPEMITCDVTMRDPGMDLVGGNADAVVHPGEVYVALEDTRGARAHAGQVLQPRVLAVTPDGARRSVPAHLELLQHLRDPKKSWGTLPGTVIASCDVVTKQDPTGCALAVPRGSLDDTGYFVVRATVKDPRGTVSSSVMMYPGSPPLPARRSPPPKKPAKPRPEAKLVADRESYERGEVATLTSQSPFVQGHALFTLEREGFLSHEVRAVDRDPLEIRVPMEEATAPHVNATATFVSPFADRTHSSHTMAASTKLSTGWGDHALSVTIRPSKSQATPGEEVDVEVDVRRHDGTPAAAEVTLYAADEGTLGLAHYRIPNVLDSFFHDRDATVSTSHTRSSLGWLFDWQEELRAYALGHGSGRGFGSGHGRLGGSHRTKPPSIRMGATTVETARRNFRQSAVYLPALTTDASGVARARVTLPESLTTYRFMAFAVTKGEDFGSSQTPVMTSMPLQVRPVLPRVIRTGDRFALAAMAANNGPQALDATVSVEVSGLAGAGPLTKSVALPAGGSTRVTFDLEATKAGAGTVKVRVRGGDGLTDAAELPIEVQPPLSVETASLRGVAEDARVDELVTDLAAVRSDMGSLEVSVSTSPLLGLGAGLEQLVTYPYGCTEQTTSRLVPLLSLRDLARALGVALPPDLAQASREAVVRVLGNQQKDGGFGLWPGSTESSPWLSTYATWGLDEARRHGVPVDEAALGRAHEHLAGLLLAWGRGPKERAAAPFALDVLAGAEGADVAGLRTVAAQLFDAREGMPLFSRALLLSAMSKLGAPSGDRAALATELAASVVLDGSVARVPAAGDEWASYLDSSVRGGAMVLRALLSAQPDHPLAQPLALGLVADRNGGTWRTTQEAAWALLALDDYRRAHPAAANADAEVQLGGETLFRHAFAAKPGELAPDGRASIPIARLLGAGERPLSFTARGKVHYEAQLRYFPKDLPTDGVMSGIEVTRRYSVIRSDVDAAARKEGRWRVDASSFEEGALVLIELEVATPTARRYVVLEDPIPGAFESYDVRMQGGPSWVLALSRETSTRTEKRDDRALFFLDELPAGTRRIAHVVRATAKGTFLAPPARIEEMYAPETFGRTGARTITVK